MRTLRRTLMGPVVRPSPFLPATAVRTHGNATCRFFVDADVEPRVLGLPRRCRELAPPRQRELRCRPDRHQGRQGRQGMGQAGLEAPWVGGACRLAGLRLANEGPRKIRRRPGGCPPYAPLRLRPNQLLPVTPAHAPRQLRVVMLSWYCAEGSGHTKDHLCQISSSCKDSGFEGAGSEPRWRQPSCTGGLGRASGEPARPQKEALRLRALSELRDEGVLSTVRKKLHNTKDVEAKKKLVRGGRKGLEGWGGRGWAAGWVEGLGC